MVYSLDLLASSGVKVKKRFQWGSQYPISRYTIHLPGRYMFMHITVTHQTGTLDHRTRVVERIGASRFPNTRFSYTAVLHPGGEVHEGQPRGRKGAHTINDKKVAGFPHDLNAYGHALAYVGMESNSFGEAEVEAAARYFASLVLSGESRATEILPHNKFAWKACPGAKVDAKLAEINRRFRKYVAAGRLPGGSAVVSTPSEWDAKDRGAAWNAVQNGIVKHSDKNFAWFIRQLYARARDAHFYARTANSNIKGVSDEVTALRQDVADLSDAVAATATLVADISVDISDEQVQAIAQSAREAIGDNLGEAILNSLKERL